MKNPLKLIFCAPIPAEDLNLERDGRSHPVYVAYRFRAEGVKILLQMIIGVALAVLLIAKLVCRIFGRGTTFWPFQMTTLDAVGHALAYSAGIELAYTLFTPGPDEALDPVMMGLAAAILLGVSNVTTLSLKEGASATFYCLALGGLFAIRKWALK